MKLMRLAMWVAIFAVIGGTAFSGDMDIQALQAKLAAQEARLNDLQAKMNSKGSASEATGVVSIRKNAVVTIGGQVNTRYFYHDAKFSAGAANARNVVATAGRWDVTNPAAPVWIPPVLAGVAGTQTKLSTGDLKVTDAKINFKIDVNDYFDAFIRINLQNGRRGTGRWSQSSGENDAVSTAQYAWVRWKNVCNSGFGLLIGRNDVVFGAADPAGMIEQGWNHNNIWFGDRFGEMGLANQVANPGLWQGVMDRMYTDHGRTVQVTPYWEGWNKKLKIELSAFHDYDVFDGGRVYDPAESKWTSTNYGQGVSGRVRVTPIEGLNLYASGINRMETANRNTPYGYTQWGATNSFSMSAVNFAFDWTPCFFPRLKVFAGWTHTWDGGFNRVARNGVAYNQTTATVGQGDAVAGQPNASIDTDVIHAGFLFNVTEQLKFVLQGDYMRGKEKGAIAVPGVYTADQINSKIEGWAIYPAIRYTLPYGVNFEVGYRYDYLKDKKIGDKFKVHTAYGQVGFDF